MPFRTYDQAVRAFRQSLQLAVPVVTSSIVTAEMPRYGSDRARQLLMLSDAPVRLQGRSRLSLSTRIAVHQVELTRRQASPGQESLGVDIAAYEYRLDDANGHEVLAYHWHPESRVKFPHVHIGAGATEGRLRPEVAAAHLPTGPILLPEFLRLLIVDFGVRPLRRDWEDVLSRSHQELRRILD